jgi:hypothetical protein
MKLVKAIASSELFDSTKLGIGEMMECQEASHLGHVILATFTKYISLTDPSSTWNRDYKLIGRKLLPGESVTLIQE